MNKIETFIEWRPDVLARERLDPRRWAYLIHAPFDMQEDIPDLLGLMVRLDGRLCEIRGTLPKIPAAPIKAGEFLCLLVRSMEH